MMERKQMPSTGVGSNHVSKIADTKSGGRPMGGKERKGLGGKKKKRTSYTSSGQ